jgi:imidazolonepropionase-like amidohydrolase
MKRIRLTFLLIMMGLVLTTFTGASAQTIAIRAGKLVDPATGTTAENMIILVEEGTIRAVGSNMNLPKDAAVLDLSSQVVLPGLVDSHTHLCDTFETNGDVGGALLLYTLTVSTADRALHGVGNAKSMLDAGFTTVRDMGNAGEYADAALQRAIESGIVPGPTFFISGKIIAPFGGQFFVNPEHPDIGKHDYFYADTRDEIKKAIRQNIHFGADWIKIVVDDYPYSYSAEDLRFIVSEAGKAGLKVAAHCVTEEGARSAVEAGLASIEHGFEMSDEILAQAKRNGVMLVATDFTQEIMDLYQFFAQPRSAIVDRLKRANRIGLPLVYGSDIISTVPGHSRGSASLSLLDSWVEAGVPPKVILQALTTNGVRLLGIQDQRGSIKKGLAADIIATSENPLDDIMTLKNVRFVMKDGKIIKELSDF